HWWHSCGRCTQRDRPRRVRRIAPDPKGADSPHAVSSPQRFELAGPPNFHYACSDRTGDRLFAGLASAAEVFAKVVIGVASNSICHWRRLTVARGGVSFTCSGPSTPDSP